MIDNQTPHSENDVLAFGPGSRAEYIARTCGEIIVRPDNIAAVPPAPGTPPYKGLLPYSAADGALFYGREEITQKLIRRLRETHFLALVGASGSGKSSLIGAGLTPALRRQKWLVQTFTPTAHPLHELASTLVHADPSLATEEQLVPTLVVNPRALPLAAGKLVARRQAQRLLLVVDQFEELFTLCTDEAERRAFLETLLAAAAEKGAATVLISVNASFYDHCLQYKGLRAVLVRAQEPLAPLAGADLLRAVAEPARHGGWRFEEGLIEHFLENAGRGPGRLPLISQALYETWRRRQGTVMSFAGYRATGGIEGAIAHTAEQTLKEVPSEQVTLVRKLFLSLSELGDGVPDSRRSATITELTRLGRAAEVASVLARFARARLLTLDGGRVRISHDAVISHWPRLRQWLADKREQLRFGRQVAADAEIWERLDHNPRALYRGPRLAHARAWREEVELEHELPARSLAFLEASAAWAQRAAREAETREMRARLQREGQLSPGPVATEEDAQPGSAPDNGRRYRLAAALLLLALLVLVTGSLTRRALDEAETEARVARARELAARSASVLPAEPLAALSLAWQAVDETYAADGTITLEARTALQEALALPTRVAILTAHQAPISGIFFSPTGDRFLATSLDGSATLWNLEGDQLARLEGGGSGMIAAGFNANGERIFTLGQDGTVLLWDNQGQLLATLAGGEERITVAAFHPAANQILTASQAGTMRLWDLAGNVVRAFPRQEAPIAVARFHPAGNRILSASGNSAILWDLEGNVAARLLGHNSGITDARFSPEGDRIVTASYDRSARIWDLQGNERARLQGHEDVVWAAAFSPDGERIVTAGGDSAHLWNLQGALLASFSGQGSGVTGADFNPAGNRLLTVGWDGSARLWDGAGRQLATLAAAAEEVNVARFSPGGARIVSAGLEGTARVWELATDELLLGDEAARARLGAAETGAAAAGAAVLPASPIDQALWAAGRSRLLRSPACPSLFAAETCLEHP